MLRKVCIFGGRALRTPVSTLIHRNAFSVSKRTYLGWCSTDGNVFSSYNGFYDSGRSLPSVQSRSFSDTASREQTEKTPPEQTDKNPKSDEEFPRAIYFMVQRGEIDQAERLLLHGSSPKNLNKVAFNILLKAYSDNGDPDRALEFLKGMIRLSREYPAIGPDEISFNTVVEAYARLGDVEKLRSVWDMMDTPNLKTYNSLLKVYGLRKEFREMDLVLEKMREKGVHPNGFTHSIMVNALAKNGRVEDAEAYFYRVLDEDEEPTIYPANTIIRAWFQERNLQRALDTFHRIQQHPTLLPDTITYNILIDGLIKNSTPSLAESMLNTMIRDYESGNAGAKPDSFGYNSVINAYSRKRNGWKAQEMLDRMIEASYENRNVRPDTVTFNVVLSALAHCSAKDKEATAAAQNLLITMETSQSENHFSRIKPDVITYTTVLQSYAKNHHVPKRELRAKALTFLNRMESLEKRGSRIVRMDATAYNIVLSALARSCEAGGGAAVSDYNTETYTIMKRILNGMLDKPEDGKHPAAKPDIISWNIVLDALARGHAASSAERILFDMETRAQKDSTARPNIISYNTVLKAWARSTAPDAVDRAQILLRSMMESSAAVSPDRASFNTVIAAMGRSGDGERAMGLLRTMLERWRETGDGRIRPDVFSFSSVIQGFAKNGKAKEAKDVFIFMKREGIEPDTICYNTLIKSIAHSKHHRKAYRVMGHLTQMRKSNVDRDAYSYNHALTACALTTSKIEKKAALEIASRIYRDMKKETSVKEDECTFLMMMKNCIYHMKSGDEKREAIRDVFEAACQKGLVGRSLMMQLSTNLSRRDFEALVGTTTQFSELPPEWVCNVKH